MSAQTGRPTVAPPAPNSRRLDRARIGLKKLEDDPNPIWMREMRQSARLQRTPVILAITTGLMALLMCSIGGFASVYSEPAKVGVALFHTFFSLAFAVVTWIAPAVAASTIASERGGRTWEALLLTGLGAVTIARGKFMAALSYISLYIVMLAPVGVLPFLFGGVSALEVVIAFLLLFCFAVLSVAFGLCISSQFSSTAVAIVVTLLIAIPVSLLTYVVGGVALSYGVHELWPAVPKGPPVWLPTAFVRADFGVEYVAFLVVAPLALTLLPAWFLYEITVANMASVSDDRSSGVRTWFLVALPAITVAAICPVFAVPKDHWAASATSMGITFLFVIVMAFVFAGEPLGPSRRVLVHWDIQRVSALRRYLGPGVTRAVSLLILGILGTYLVQIAVGVVVELEAGSPSARENAYRVVAFGGYLAAFCVFLAGFIAFTRARSTSSGAPRGLLVLALFLAGLGPWLAMAVAGIATRSDESFLVAAPSPAYVFVMLGAIGSPKSSSDVLVLAGVIAASAWALLGLGLFGAGVARSRKVVREHRDAQAKLDAMLAEEEAGATEVYESAENQGDPSAAPAAPPAP
jgi:ABC-type transport system involved in multi-copper enzyme maturation permease subunit